MRNEVSTRPTCSQIDTAANLEDMAARANAAHAQVMATARHAVENALLAGQTLLRAKRLCPFGTWRDWLSENFKGSERTAQAYMRMATHCLKVGGDPLRAAEVSRRKLEKMVLGLGRSDCPNPQSSVRPPARSKSGSSEVASQAATSDSTPSTPEPETGFDRVARLLGQAVAELQRLADAEDAEYADHVLARLRLLHDGLRATRWFHHWKVGPDWR